LRASERTSPVHRDGENPFEVQGAEMGRFTCAVFGARSQPHGRPLAPSFPPSRFALRRGKPAGARVQRRDFRKQFIKAAEG
jgi:hypothetical protein